MLCFTYIIYDCRKNIEWQLLFLWFKSYLMESSEKLRQVTTQKSSKYLLGTYFQLGWWKKKIDERFDGEFSVVFVKLPRMRFASTTLHEKPQGQRYVMIIVQNALYDKLETGNKDKFM